MGYVCDSLKLLLQLQADESRWECVSRCGGDGKRSTVLLTGRHSGWTDSAQCELARFSFLHVANKSFGDWPVERKSRVVEVKCMQVPAALGPLHINYFWF